MYFLLPPPPPPPPLPPLPHTLRRSGLQFLADLLLGSTPPSHNSLTPYSNDSRWLLQDWPSGCGHRLPPCSPPSLPSILTPTLSPVLSHSSLLSSLLLPPSFPPSFPSLSHQLLIVSYMCSSLEQGRVRRQQASTVWWISKTHAAYFCFFLQ